ncbi:hypothetical protein BSL78_02070 [Apostichopus japonicus]|uniref:Ig-like domain-containing protein n=1 Tax=Stichopus japonicus TaxID=307972 RepID=A0A2G8LL90_STIJA|nr:hypothetical protein BSL78_02070 [Apostichopus japonicus]
MFVYEKEETARIPCIIRGESQAYFWKVGTMFNESKSLASFIHGSPDKFANETFGKHTVLGDGTLVIYRMTYTDVGNYHCRVVTKSSEYYGSAAVYIKAFRNGSTFGIDECESNANCRLQTKVDSLTCEAAFVSSQLRLRWLNNSIELESSEITVQNDDESFNVSSTFAVNDDSPSILICEAYGEAMESKHILIELMDETERPATESLTGTSPWMPVSIVLIIVVICMVVVLLIKYKDQSKKENPNTGEETQLLIESTEKESNNRLKTVITEFAERSKRAKSLAIKKETYKLTRIFEPEEEQGKVFSHLEDIVQSAVDGNMICIVAIGAPKSGKTFTMSNYDSSAKDSQGIIPRAISKIFECEKDLQKKGFEALDLLKGSPMENKGMSAGTKRADLFQITVEIFINQEKVLQGILSLVTFHGADATKQLISNEKDSPIMSLLTPLITDKSCLMAMIVTIKMDTSPETQETLHFIEKMREASEKRFGITKHAPGSSN